MITLAEEETKGPVPLSIDVMRRALGPQVEADREAIRLWVRGSEEPDFAAIAERMVPAIATLMERGWLELDEDRRERVVESLEYATGDSLVEGFRGSVSELVEVVHWALRPTVPSRPPPRGPLANQMALVRPR